ncbi:MAG: tetratricopeptide repeat protein [Pseudomonadota bacterium]
MAKPKKSIQQDAILMQAAQAQDWKTAERRVRQFIRKNSRDLEALLLLADIQMQKNDATEALAAFERVLQIQPDLPMAHFGRGRTLLALKRTTEAIDSLELYAQSQPGDVEALINLGICYLTARKSQQAAECFTRAYDTGTLTEDQSYFVRMALVQAHRDDGALDDMREQAREIFKDFPSSRAALWQLLTYGQKGRVPLRVDRL